MSTLTADASTAAADAAIVAAAAGTYLTFEVANEEFGVSILKVREIIGMLPITVVPGSPGAMLGVVNLRGRVIPVISMRARCSLPPGEAHPHNVILVVEAASGLTGLAVDRVREVASFKADDLEPPPKQGLAVDTGFVSALGKSQDKIRILIDLSRLLAA